MLQWKTATTTTAGTASVFDGAANTAAMVTAGIADHPAAQFCVGLSIGGFTDWYLPSQFELDIAYFNLKPDSSVNFTGTGINIYSIPQRNSNYTTTYPAQTALTAFNTTAEAFIVSFHWSSTQLDPSNGVTFNFSNGLRSGQGQASNPTKTNTNLVRAFRRIAL
jgi:nucleoside-specific outer membrane channel protein Tsx